VGAGLAEEIESRLRPLANAVNVAWWDASVEATDDNEQRRIAAQLAFSDALADADAFHAVETARRDGLPDPARAAASRRSPRPLKLLEERLFAPGLSVRWDRLVERASGRPLSVESLAREVAAA
jgi:hypothetical protein